MRRNTGVVLKQRVALAVIAVLAFNPSVTLAGGGPPEAAARPSAARVGSLVVESEPAGAAVYVDGHLAGETPLQVASLTAGDHRVRVVKGGYLENARLVSVGSSPSTVRVRLTRDAGTRPELAAQLGGGGGGGGGGGSKLPLILALAGGGAVAAILIAKKGGDSSPATPPNNAPTVGSFTASPTTAITATTTTLTAVGAADSDGDPLTFSWDFGDSTPAGTGATTTHVYTTAATRTVTVTVTDGKGGSVTATGSLVVKSLTFATWTTTYVAFSGFTLSTNLTQSGTNLTGSFSGGSPSSGSVSGSVNATTRQIVLVYTCTVGTSCPGGVWTSTYTANAAVNTLTGPTTDNAGSTYNFGGAIGVMSRP